MARSVAGLLLLLVCAFAPAPFPRREPRGDLQRLQGEWRLVRSAFGGSWVEGSRVTFRLQGDRATFRHGPQMLNTWKVRLNASKPLKELDLEAASVSRIRAGTVIPCVYRLENDELTIWEPSGESRPTSIEPNPALLVSVYRRQKR
jgi:uncharacterized protein (TIGR03067 family)